MKRFFLLILGFLFLLNNSGLCFSVEKEKETDNIISFTKTSNDFVLFNQDEIPAAIVIDENDENGLIKIAGYFQQDIQKVSGIKPEVIVGKLPKTRRIIIVGTIGKNSLINQLIETNKIDVSAIIGKWESSIIQAVKNPFPGIEEALVIAGSDKRGAIYGMFELSRKMGVSPWYWWADVPVHKKSSVYVHSGPFIFTEPKVKYRGIFLNDEEPALGRWAVKNYGGFNHEFYEKVFELILRLKGNYIWPAMWWASFNSDDPQNPVLANEMGIVMGTTHHEPMNRAHAEWKPYGGKEWNYETNPEQLQQFWKEGLERKGSYETIVNVGMRGDGDVSMSAETNTALLEKIVKDQREIIENVTGKSAEETPQLWALYKEVQDYYEKGMRVPDDVTLLLCDDNWGNVRYLPAPDDLPRKGGYGMYYHFDFVGGPRNYKWLNTSPVPRIWEQMRLTYEHGVDRIWLVNVGDLKPMELPISFFLDYAWNPDNYPVNKMSTYTKNWAKEQFGEKHAKEIAKILDLYTKYNGRRTPELLYSDTYSLENYREFETVVYDYNLLVKKAETILAEIPDEQKDAFYQLVYHPVLACANLYELYFSHALNLLYAKQGRAATNKMAEKVKALFQKDAEITNYFHTELANGKWDNMMAQTHIGYDNWQQPEKNKMPEVLQLEIQEKAEMGIAIEGTQSAWPGKNHRAILPSFDSVNNQHFYIEIFNKGQVPFQYKIETSENWVNISQNTGEINQQERIEISVDWEKLKEGIKSATLNVSSEKGEKVIVELFATKYNSGNAKGFIEKNGKVSIDAVHFSNKKETEKMNWEIIPDLGKTGSSVTTVPVNLSLNDLSEKNPVLEYNFYLLHQPEKEMVGVDIYLSPTLNFTGNGLHFAVSIDDEKPQIINMHEGMTVADWKYPQWFNNAVSNKIIVKNSDHRVKNAGNHTLKIYAIDRGIVFQKIVIDNGGVKTSYLGPPETKLIK